MNGRELRGAMWKQVKGRRGYLLLALLITMVPMILQSLLTAALNISLPLYVGNPFLVFTNLLTIGLCKIAMAQVGDGKKSLKDMFFFLKDGVFGKALILSVLLWIVNTAFSVLPGLLEQYGIGMMAQGAIVKTGADGLQKLMVSDQGLYAQGEIFKGLGMLFSLASSFISTVIFFPIQYRFALRPEEPLMDQLAEGVAIGWKNLWGVFGFLFIVSIPYGFAQAVFGVCPIFFPEYALFVVTAYVIFLCIYLPYKILAEAALAKRLFVMEEKGQIVQDTGRRLRG